MIGANGRARLPVAARSPFGSCHLAGLMFIGVQINRPDLNATSITTNDVYIRDSLKVLMAVLALAGITGMYLSQIRRNGVLGLVGYVLLAAGYLLIMCGVFAAAYV